jgi:hypothetical protein
MATTPEGILIFRKIRSARRCYGLANRAFASPTPRRRGLGESMRRSRGPDRPVLLARNTVDVLPQRRVQETVASVWVGSLAKLG